MKQKQATKKGPSPKKNIPHKPAQRKQGPVVFPEFTTYFNKYGHFFMGGLLLILCFLVFKDFIFQNKLYLFKDIGSDSINANYPHGYMVAYYMNHISLIPKWSFYQGMGQNIFPLSITDPFYFLLTLSGEKNVAGGIGIMEATKVLCAGLFFYLFLKKLNISPYAATIGAICYAFSGFIILGGEWNIFSTEAVYFALLLYAFEKLYQENKILLFPITIFLIAINQPFDLFPTSLFLVIYILFRLYPEQKLFTKKTGLFVAKVAGLGIVGVLMSSFFVFADILQMLESPRVGGESSYFSKLLSAPLLGMESKTHNATALLRFFSTDMLGTGSSFGGWNNYLEAPLFYFGLIHLVLFPQVFTFLDKKRKLVFGIFILLFLLPILFPFFRYAFWLFTGDYYRLFSLFVVVSLSICSLNALTYIDKQFRVNFVILGLTSVVLLIILFYSYFPEEEVVSTDMRAIAALFLVLYTIAIGSFAVRRISNVSKLVVLLLVCAELVIFSNQTINSRPVITGQEMKAKIGYNDYSNDAVAFLKQRDKSFFRLHKEYASGLAIHRSMNDAQVQNYFSTLSYFSFNQKNYIRFLDGMHIIDGKDEIQTRWAPGLINAPFLHSFASIKYYFTKQSNSQLLNFNYDSIGKVGDVIILQNRYPLPLGYSYDRYITNTVFRQLSDYKKQLVIYKAVIIDDSLVGKVPGLTEFKAADTTNYQWGNYASDVDSLKKDSLTISSFDQNLIKGDISMASKKLLFFSIPYDPGWTATVDGKPANLILTNIGFCGLLLEPGKHQVTLSFTPRLYKTGSMVSLIGLVLFLLVMGLKFYLDRKQRVANTESQQ